MSYEGFGVGPSLKSNDPCTTCATVYALLVPPKHTTSSPSCTRQDKGGKFETRLRRGKKLVRQAPVSSSLSNSLQYACLEYLLKKLADLVTGPDGILAESKSSPGEKQHVSSGVDSRVEPWRVEARSRHFCDQPKNIHQRSVTRLRTKLAGYFRCFIHVR